jgi:probable phosphoglycerate mutase
VSSPELRSSSRAGRGSSARDYGGSTAPAAATLVVVSHGALIREIIRHATGGELPLAGERLANGSTHDFVYERDHLRLLAYAGYADSLA